MIVGNGRNRIAWRIAAALALATPAATQAQPPAPEPAIPQTRDGARDFGFTFGSWSTEVRVLRNPLTGQPPQWAEYRGTSVVRPLLDGRANFVELKVAGAEGRIEGGSLRLYNPTARQWSLNYATLTGGVLTAPVFGGFDANGRGRFVGQDTVEGRIVLVRFDITPVSPREIRFEQAYSADGGETWEPNWIATDRKGRAKARRTRR